MSGPANIHGAHPYPCKFPSESIRQFLDSGGGTLVDPFCGSGTTVVEAARGGWDRVYGFDSNPIAVLISQYKTLTTDKAFFTSANSALADLTLSAERTKPKRALNFQGATHWFADHVLRELEQILEWIELREDERVKTWLRLSLSRILNRISRQDSETRYVAVDRRIERGETLSRFNDSAGATLALLRDREPLVADTAVAEADISVGIPLSDGSVDRIVTSPPYANSMDYYLYHKQRMNVLGFDFKRTQSREIGSRHEYSSLRAPAEKWSADYKHSLSELRRVLRPGGDAIVIIGDSQIAGKKLDAAELTASIATELGFDTIALESVSLDGRSRSFSRGFQRPNKFEHVLRLVAKAVPILPDDAVFIGAVAGRA